MHYSDFYKTLIEKIEIPENAQKEFAELVVKLDEDLQFGREVDKLIMRFMFPKAHDIRRFLEKLSLLAKKYSERLISFADLKNSRSKILSVEPGDPKSARLLSLMRF